MCHSFETYDPQIAIREVEARLMAPAFSFPVGLTAAIAGAISAIHLRFGPIEARGNPTTVFEG